MGAGQRIAHAPLGAGHRGARRREVLRLADEQEARSSEGPSSDGLLRPP
jgi:hypothetical protein